MSRTFFRRTLFVAALVLSMLQAAPLPSTVVHAAAPQRAGAPAPRAKSVGSAAAAAATAPAPQLTQLVNRVLANGLEV
ncbi:MAG: hypothetical protein M3R15_17620, partial [Acidobacteriota bacterium]|nr:hypothetical protein [Acidobacteriota bacterium]